MESERVGELREKVMERVFWGFFLKVSLNERARKRPFKLAFFSSNPSLVVINGVSDRGNVC